MRTALVLTIFALAFAAHAESEESTIRFKLPDSSTTSSSKGPAHVSSGITLSNSKPVEQTCPAGQTITKASCDAELRTFSALAQGPLIDIVTGPAGLDKSPRPILTKTEILKTDDGDTARCHTLNARPDDVVKVSMSVTCQSQPSTIQ